MLKISSINGVAVGQWKQITDDRKLSTKQVKYKIMRAIHLGKLSYAYASGDLVYRYFNINILVSANTSEVMVAWRDYNTPMVEVPQGLKNWYDKVYGREELFRKKKIELGAE